MRGGRLSDPRVILVILGAAATDAADDAIVASARDALGGDAVVLVEAAPGPRTDEQALELGDRVRATAVVRVVWADGAKRSAHLDVRVAPSTDWAADDIAFAAGDALGERGRAVGFAISTMVERLQRAQVAAPPPPPPARPPPPPPAAVTPQEAPVATPLPRASTVVEVFGVGAATTGASATSFGAAAGARLWPRDFVAARAAVGARFGSIPDASASTVVLLFDAGLVARLARFGPVAVEARAGALALRQTVSRSYPTGDVTRERWLPGAAGGVELVWWVSARTALTAAAGSEVAFGTIDVDVGGSNRAVIEPVRALGELGARFRL